ncbi:MAG: three-Cys-motif partner protein TcmP [Gammaproteobacteria bacterium]
MTKRKPSDRHQWGEGVVPVLSDHSVAKHEILSEYIQRYLDIVCQNHKRREFNITLVDGFAGGGIYQDGKHGSPLVMMEAVSRATIDVNKGRKTPINIDPHYFFIEENADNYASLKETLFNNQHSKNIFSRKGDFNSHVDEIISHVKTRNPRGGGGAILFLDQEGYSSVHMGTLNKIRRSLPQAEIILTFAISWLIDFISSSDELIEWAEKIGLDSSLNVDETWRMIGGAKDKRNVIESQFSRAIQEAAGFPFLRPFFIEPEDNHRGYLLLHLAWHYRAHNAMTETIWDKKHYMRHYGGVGTHIFEVFYKGGRRNVPLLFGKLFAEEAWAGHIEGLVEDLPKKIWQFNDTTVGDLIQRTCNETAAPPEMYFETLAKLRDNNEVAIFGGSGGKKRSSTVSLSDRIEPQRQKSIFLNHD